VYREFKHYKIELSINYFEKSLKISRYATTIDNHISMKYQTICIIVSVLSSIAFFQKNNITMLFINIMKNLHQSNAGRGKRLKIARLRLNIAAIIINKINFALKFIKSINSVPKDIGHQILEIASFLSVLVFGVTIFDTITLSHSKIYLV